MQLMAVADLCERWGYTRLGVHKLIKKEDFPLPVAIVAKGRFKIFKEEDIELYEQDKPWLFSKEQKTNRQRSFGVGLSEECVENNKEKLLEKTFEAKAHTLVYE